jgi:cardiolipin synthase
MDMLVKKAHEGVDVRMLMPGPETDGPLVRFASHGYYRELLNAGVHIYEYQPSLIHEKAMVADGQWSIIGSANIDNRSREINDENVFGIQDPSLAQELTDNFNGDLEYSKEVTANDWNHRGIGTRILSAISGIFYKQF